MSKFKIVPILLLSLVAFPIIKAIKPGLANEKIMSKIIENFQTTVNQLFQQQEGSKLILEKMQMQLFSLIPGSENCGKHCTQESSCGGGGWLPLTQSLCYKIVTQPESMEQASESCRSLYNPGFYADIPQLITIESVEKEHDIVTILKNSTLNLTRGLWLSAIRSNTTFNWQNLDESSLPYTNWASGSPRNSTAQNCIQLRMDDHNHWKWFDVPCATLMSFICEKTKPLSYTTLLKDHYKVQNRITAMETRVKDSLIKSEELTQKEDLIMHKIDTEFRKKFDTMEVLLRDATAKMNSLEASNAHLVTKSQELKAELEHAKVMEMNNKRSMETADHSLKFFKAETTNSIATIHNWINTTVASISSWHTDIKRQIDSIKVDHKKDVSAQNQTLKAHSGKYNKLIELLLVRMENMEHSYQTLAKKRSNTSILITTNTKTKDPLSSYTSTSNMPSSFLETPILHISPTALPIPMDRTSTVYDGDDSIYILGGRISGGWLKSILRYSITAEKIEQVATLPVAIASGTAFWDGVGVVYFGGWNDGAASNKIFRYVPGSPVTVEQGTLPIKNAHSTIVTTGLGQALIFGGHPNEDHVVEYSNGIVQERNYPLSRRVYGHSSVHFDRSNENSVFLFGGCNDFDGRNSILKYNTQMETSFILNETLPSQLCGSVAVYNGRYAFIIGGSSEENYSGVVRFNPINNELSIVNVNNFPRQLKHSSAVFVPKLNRAYIFGGEDFQRDFRDTIMYLNF